MPSIYDQELREKYQSLNTIVLESDACPLNVMCQVERSIYQATVTCDDDPTYGEKLYIGLAEPKFKKRFANHKTSFSNECYEKETELSKEIRN